MLSNYRDSDKFIKLVKEIQSISAYQAKELFRDYPPQKVRAILMEVDRSRKVYYEKDKDYYRASKLVNHDYDVRNAMDVYLKFMNKNTDMLSIYKGVAPVTLGFIKDNEVFEVVSKKTDEEVIWAAKQLDDNASLEDVTYFFVVKDKTAINYFPDIKIKHYIAYFEREENGYRLERPNITFFKKEVLSDAI